MSAIFPSHMRDSIQHPESFGPEAARFATTRWSTVLAARDSVSPASDEALARLCEGYWYPLYAYVRRCGHDPDDAPEQTAEERYRLEPVDAHDPEWLYERRWALTLLQAALTRLEDDYRSAGKASWFEPLRSVLLAEPEAPRYAELARQFAVSESAIKVAVHRMRRTFRRLLREEIADTVARPEEVDEEIRHLFAVLSAP
jgi:hypothetical protein